MCVTAHSHKDQLGLELLNKLTRRFGGWNILPERTTPHLSPCTFGIEIEVPWRVYYRDLWEKHFRSGKKKYSEFTKEEQEQVTAECNPREKFLLLKLEDTVGCGLPRGRDKYWEFSFPPVQSVEILVCIAGVLNQAGLLPFGEPLSLQVTAGGVLPSKQVYRALMILEMLYGSEERIRSAIVQNDLVAWARKGRAGVAPRTVGLYFNEKVATEFRPLVLPPTLDGLYQLLRHVELLISWIWSTENGIRVLEWEQLKKSLGMILAEFGLPDENWGKPNQNQEVWRRFADNFDPILDRVREVSPVV
jgi:hypothetical protein